MLRKYCSINLKSTSLLTCLSISTMCLLIYASIIIITVISITPIIILGLGEINAGQRDVILRPVNSQQSYINTTKIAELSGQIAMPRHQTLIGLGHKNAVGWFMDLDLQLQQHLGTLQIIPEPDQSAHYIYVHGQFGLNIGDSVQVNLKQSKILLESIKNNLQQTMQQNYGQIIKQIDFILQNQISIGGNFTVIGIYDLAMGKFAIDASTGTAYLNMSSAFEHIMSDTYIDKKLNGTYLLSYMRQVFRLSDYSTECTINIENRIEVYSNSDYQQTYNTLSNFGEQILQKIGLFSVASQIPIAENLEEMSYFGMFIGVILKLIIVSLFTLSILMMNNMLNIGIERKSFDFAVVKTMGANRIFVILNLLVDSLKYVLLANFIAFPFAYLSLTFISGIFVTFFGYHYDVEPSIGAIAGGFFIGVLVPIVSSIAPIWGVINNDLAENLNPVRNKTESIKTQIYIEGSEFPVGKLLFGVIATTFGLMIYYLLPKGLINQDISLLLFVFFSILVGLLLGLILLSYSFQYLFEKLVAYITLFWTNKTDFTLTMKNLSAHRIKNRRTSLLYSLSVSMVIFVSVGLNIQIQTIAESMLQRHGTYLQIRSNGGSINKQYYDTLFSTKFSQQISDWSYQTIPLHDYLRSHADVVNVLLSDKAKLYFKSQSIYGISPNYLKVMPGYQSIPITESIAYSPYDPYQFLYSPDGYMTCTMSEYLAKKYNILDTVNKQFLLNAYQKQSVQRIKLNVSTIFHKRAGLGYSKFSFGRQQIGISFDTFMNLSGIRSYDQLPYSKIKLQVVDPQKTQILSNAIRNQLMMHNMDSLWDYSQVKGTIDQINSLLENILIILLVLVLLISFFSLVTTSYINIINQSTQIAILMTLGYTKIRIVKIYIYEAFVLVLNSCLIGVAVGAFVAWMMGLQRQLFGDFPVKIQINGIWIIGVASIISSLLSTIKPIRDIFKQSINQIFQYS